MIIKKNIRTNRHEELIDITGLIQEEISKNSIKEGNAVIFVPHTTAAVTINENADPTVQRDILAGLDSLNLNSVSYKHSEGNSVSHIKSSMIGCSLNVIIDGGRLLLGTWQGVYFCEFDGPRNRSFIIQIR